MASSEDIPFPHGWERKYDRKAERHYYVDHFIKKTQWEDPRLHHEQIWRQERKDMLEHLRVMFKDAPEDKLREALIETRFFEPGAVNHLINLGYKKSSLAVGPAVTTCDHKETGRAVEPAVSDSTSGAKSATTGRPVDLEMVGLGDAASMSPSPRSRAEKTSPRTSTGASKRTRDQSDAAGDDHFTLLHMKAMFPETNDDVLVDVLNQCGQNLELACRELRNMGYAGRQKADVRIVESVLKTDDSEKVRKHREKEDRNQTLRQLKHEFESFLDADISNVFAQSKFDLYETRSALRRQEADLKLQALKSSEESATTTSQTVTILVSEEPEAADADASIGVPERRRASASISPAAVGKEIIPKTPTKSKSHKEKSKKEITTSPFTSLDGNGASAATQRATRAVCNEVSKSTGATPSHQVAGHTSLAKGPDARLRHGSDPSLRIGGSCRAIGPDPGNHKGPNAQLRQVLA